MAEKDGVPNCSCPWIGSGRNLRRLMAKMENVDRGPYRVENEDGSIRWMIDYLNPDKKRI